MTYRSLLIIQCVTGTGAEAVEAYDARNVLAECAEAIPEYLRGRVWQSRTDPDRLFVEVDWSAEKGWHDWMDSPVRAAQMTDLGRYVVGLIHSDLYSLAT